MRTIHQADQPIHKETTKAAVTEQQLRRQARWMLNNFRNVLDQKHKQEEEMKSVPLFTREDALYKLSGMAAHQQGERVQTSNIANAPMSAAMNVDDMLERMNEEVVEEVSKGYTVTTLSTIRELKAHGVEVWFQKENIQTFDPKSELITSIMSSLAQEESRSISENVSWGIRKSFADGKVSFKYKQFLGYRRGADGKPEIDPEEAKIVRTIYRRFLEGETPYMIAKALTNQGIPTKTGKAKWSISTIRSILSNECYKGEAILQKKYTTDFLTKKQKKNEGELPQYHVTGSHPPIVSAEVWDMVQLELERRARIGARYSTGSALASRLVCSDCGGFYGPKVWHSTGTNRMIVWRCNNKYKRNLTRASGQKKCASHHVIEEQVMSAFDKVVTQLLENRPEVVVACESVLTELLDTSSIDEKLSKVRSEAEEASRQVKALIDSQMREPSDSFKEKYAEIEKRYEAIQENIAVLEQEKTDRQFRAGEAEAFLNTMKDMESLSRDELFIALIDKVVVGKQFTFVLKDGSERVAVD